MLNNTLMKIELVINLSTCGLIDIRQIQIFFRLTAYGQKEVCQNYKVKI